jgi:hypothetical protein
MAVMAAQSERTTQRIEDMKRMALIGMELGVPAMKKEAEDMAKRSIKTGGGLHQINSADPVRKPKCPEHREDMAFDPRISRWKCQQAGCKFTARRKEEDGDAEATPQRAPLPTVRPTMPSKPLQKHGPKAWELSIKTDTHGEEHYYLHHSSVSFGMDVTDYVETVIDDQTNSVTLCLLFNKVKRT